MIGSEEDDGDDDDGGGDEGLDGGGDVASFHLHVEAWRPTTWVPSKKTLTLLVLLSSLGKKNEDSWGFLSSLNRDLPLRRKEIVSLCLWKLTWQVVLFCFLFFVFFPNFCIKKKKKLNWIWAFLLFFVRSLSKGRRWIFNHL